tara:strand:- start:506 stop:886 length:381 start_codon:yes stop_codon:yes gene_type:complete
MKHSSKPLLCLDFDGVIHSYSSGWRGADVIQDAPVPGAIDFIKEALLHFRVAIFSSRSGQDGGIDAMQDWLHFHSQYDESERDWVSMIEWPTVKPPARVTIDDRAIQFTGSWPGMVELKNFRPWNK